MRKIALVNQKGGVGKTTTAVNLAAGLASLGRRVLVVDLDPQANATLALGFTPADVKVSVYELLRGEAKAGEALLERAPGLLLLPSSLNLAGVEMELAQTIGRETVLKDALTDLPGLDFVLIDCPPSLGLLNINALTAVEEVVIPLQCEFFALQGIAMLVQTVGLVQKRLNPRLKVTGVIPCLFDARKGLAREVVAEIEKHFGERVYRTRVRANVRLAEAPSHGKTIFEYAPDSHGAADYLSLAREVAGLPAEATESAGPAAKAELPAGAGEGAADAAPESSSVASDSSQASAASVSGVSDPTGGAAATTSVPMPPEGGPVAGVVSAGSPSAGPTSGASS